MDIDPTATESIEIDLFDKTCLFVGRYLAAWALMEGRVDFAIRNGLGLTALQGAIVCANTGFTSKCHILQTLESLGRAKKKGQRHDNEKLLERTKNLSGDRNMIAHNLFFPGKTKKGEFCVDFTIILAKGNFDLPSVKWTEKLFNEKIEELYQVAEKIDSIGKSFSKKKLMAELLKPNPKPIQGLFGLGLAGLPSHQPQSGGLLGSYFSNPKTTPQTPPEAEA